MAVFCHTAKSSPECCDRVTVARTATLLIVHAPVAVAAGRPRPPSPGQDPGADASLRRLHHRTDVPTASACAAADAPRALRPGPPPRVAAHAAPATRYAPARSALPSR